MMQETTNPIDCILQKNVKASLAGSYSPFLKYTFVFFYYAQQTINLDKIK